MKNMKKYFKMMITAVICFAMSLVPGKNVSADIMTVVSNGQAVSNTDKRSRKFNKHMESAVVNHQYETFVTKSVRQGSFIKKIFFWMQGPGDRAAGANDDSGVIKNQNFEILQDSG